MTTNQIQTSGTFSRLMSYALNYKPALVAAFVLLFIATGATLLGPYLIKVFIDDYLSQDKFEFVPVLILAVTYVIAQLVGATSFYKQSLRFNRIALNIIQTIREDVFSHVTKLPFSYLDNTPTGSLISRITNDTESIKELYVSVISSFVQNIVRILGILIAMALLDIKMMLICASLLPIVFVLMLVYQKLATPVFQTVRSLLSDINARINENIEGMAVIQLMNQQQAFVRAFKKTSTEHYQAKVKTVVISGLLLRTFIDLIHSVFLAAILFGFGIIELNQQGAVQVGVIYAFINYLGNIIEPLSDMTSKMNMAQQALVSASRVFQLIDREPEAQGDNKTPLPHFDLAFSIDKFSYDGKKDVLSDLSFNIKEGEFVGIVGHTGSGKSTLMSLLMNFYPIAHGQIRIGNQQINELHASVRTQTIGFVQQDPFIFSGSIADNIRLELNLSHQDVVEAAKQAQLHDIITAMPEGYNTVLVERGNNLSTGQRQLLSLARTLARKPKILILDEATANIDSHTEALVQRSLMALRGHVTLIAIAHRLSTVKDADKLLVLHQGHLQQMGSHTELVAEEGLYKHMYELQQQSDPTEVSIETTSNNLVHSEMAKNTLMVR